MDEQKDRDEREEGMSLSDFFKIDKDMGESRGAQVAAVVLLVALILFVTYWDDIQVIMGW